MKFLVDMPVTPRLVDWLAAAGHDAVHASAVGLASATDQLVITRALAERRIVVTADLDYPRLLALSGAEAPGIILFRGASYTDDEMLDLLRRALRVTEELDFEHSIVVVDRERIRRRRLPVER